MGEMRRGATRAASCLLAIFLIGPIGPIRPIAPASAAEINPTARLKVVKTTTLWKSPDGKVGARMARFSPDGRWLAWFTTRGEFMAADRRAKNKITTYAYRAFRLCNLVWGDSDRCAVCMRFENKLACPVVVRLDVDDDDLLGGAHGAYNVAWRSDAKYIAFSTRNALQQIELSTDKTIKLLDQQKGWRPRRAPAYEDIVFVGKKVAGRAAGTMKWWLAEPGKKPVALGELRGLCPDPKRHRLYAVPWLAGPARIPRGAGIVCIDPREKQPKRRVIVPFDHKSGRPYWLVDVWDATYPTTLRVSPDGATLTFCGVKAGVLAKNAWREFCIWRVPADGSAPPKVAAKCGPIFKRLDVGDTHCIGWRYRIDKAVVLIDLVRARAWRLPKDFYVQRVNTDVLVDKLLVGAARGKDVVLIQLAEDKP